MIKKSKTCSVCGIEKELDAFVKNKASSDGRYSICKECSKLKYQQNKKEILKSQKIYYQANRADKIKAADDYRRRRLVVQPDYRAVESRRAFARRIRISPDVVEEHYKRQFMKQQAHCGICGRVTEKLCIDHNHRLQGAASLRGLLCGACNVGISWFDDNKDFCLNAGAYLSNYD